MAFSMAVIARVRICFEPASLIQNDQDSSRVELLAAQLHFNEQDISRSSTSGAMAVDSLYKIPFETRLKWVTSISEFFLGPCPPEQPADVRDIDLVLKSNGSIESLADTATTQSPENVQLREYPARYQIPKAILAEIDSAEEKVKRTELFALGCILYQLLSGKAIFAELGDDDKREEEIQRRYVQGLFPDDLWGLDKSVRILICWCPKFAEQFFEFRAMESRGNDRLGNRLRAYIQNHPVQFGLQVLGGAVSLAALATLHALGAIGFAAAGPVVGSAAAAWQASIGLVEAGSLFAWCQSAAMGGAAFSAIFATGLTGAGVAVAAGLAGALDQFGDREAMPNLKEKFLEAWKKDVRGGKAMESKL